MHKKYIKCTHNNTTIYIHCCFCWAIMIRTVTIIVRRTGVATSWVGVEEGRLVLFFWELWHWKIDG